MKRRIASFAWLALGLVIVPYALAINPYFLPGVYDDVVYYFGAKAILSSGGFMFDGKHVVDWAPGLPMLLSIPFALGLESVVIAKIVIVLCVAASLFAAYALLRREERPHALFVCALWGLLPNAFLTGARMMSEWPFIALSFAFFLALDELRERRRTVWMACLAGALLGAASLTRYAGVALGVALVAQAATKLYRERRARAIVPELVAAAVGAGAFIAWRVYLLAHIADGTAAVRYHTGAKILAHPELQLIPTTLSDLMLHSGQIADVLRLPPIALFALALVPTTLVVIGLAARLRSRARRPTDWYVVAVLALFTVLEWKHTRYLLPIAPFLLGYLLEGTAIVAHAVRSLRRRALLARDLWRTIPGRVALAIWLVGVVAIDGYLLVRGNETTHRGLSVLASPTPESFYLGYWRDLYEAGHALREEPSRGPVGVTGTGDRKYVIAFSGGRRAIEWPAREHVGHLVVVAPARVRADREERFIEIGRYRSVTVYRAGSPGAALSVHRAPRSYPPTRAMSVW